MAARRTRSTEVPSFTTTLEQAIHGALAQARAPAGTPASAAAGTGSGSDRASDQAGASRAISLACVPGSQETYTSRLAGVVSRSLRTGSSMPARGGSAIITSGRGTAASKDGDKAP